MAEDIGAKITLQGEREFRDALKQIESGLKVNASALTLVTAQYADNAKSVEALTAKNNSLKDSLNTQKEKIDTIREALTASAQKYGEADKRTMNWQASLNTAEAELIKMDSELKKNNSELEQAQKSMDKYGLKADEVAEKTNSFGGRVNELVSAIGINLPAGAQEAIKALDGQKVSTLALVGATVALVTGFAKASFAAADFADDILTLSSQTGISTDTLQELKYAAEFVDVSLETMTGSMAKMVRSMSSAQNGSKEASEAFRKLHISITNNGQLKDSEQMFYELIDALGKVKNETERDALAMQIFGKSAQDLNPLIEAGSARLKELGEEAQKLGIIMSPENLGQLGDLKDQMDKLNAQTSALKLNLGLALIPVLSGLFNILNKINPQVLATVAIVGSIAVIAVSVIKAIGSITSTFSAMNPATLKTTAIVVGVVAALIALAAVIAVIVGKGDELNKTMANVGNSVVDMTSTVNNAGNRVQIGRNATGTNNWRGGLTWVNEEGGEILDLPRGTRIIPHDVSMEMARSSNTQKEGDVYLTLNVKMNEVDEVYKLINVVKQLKQAGRVKAVMA